MKNMETKAKERSRKKCVEKLEEDCMENLKLFYKILKKFLIKEK